MKKIAVFVEGQTELIFVRKLLMDIIDPQKLSIACYSLVSGEGFKEVPFPIKCPTAELYFQIMDIGGDNKILGVIKDREENLVKADFEKILALRDMYSDEYDQMAQTVDDDVINNMVTKKQEIIKTIMSYPNRIKLFFAIMETEAWFLGFYKLFERMDSKLTKNYIKQKTKIAIDVIDSEREFFKPSNKVRKILHLVNKEYDKSYDIVNKVVGNIKPSDYEDVQTRGVNQSFKEFYTEIKSYS